MKKRVTYWTAISGHVDRVTVWHFRRMVKAGYKWNEFEGERFVYLTKCLDPNGVLKGWEAL